MKQLTLILGIGLVLGLFAKAANTPPPPSFISVQEALDKKNFQCKVPPFMWNIPSLMADDYRICFMKKFKPSPRKVQVVLTTKVNKNAKLISIKPESSFFDERYENGKECLSSKAGLKNKNIMCQTPVTGLGLYEITYKIGEQKKVMVCNHVITYCLEKKVIVSDKR